MTVHIISILVKNQPGVLAQLSELFSHSGYNIERIKAAKFKKTDLTKIKLATTAGDRSLDSLIEQLGDMNNVVHVDITVQRRFSFWLVAFCLCVTLLGNNLPAPFYSIYRTEMQLSSSTMTFAYALYALIVIPTILLVAQLSERVSRKNLLLAGVFFSIMGSFGLALTSGVNGLLLSRFFQGLSVGILNGIAVTAMTQLHDQQDRFKSAFIAAVAGTLGNAIGPLISGFLGEYGPYPLQLSYSVHILLAIVGLIGLQFILDNKTTVKKCYAFQIPSIERDIRGPFILASTTAFLSWGIMSLMLSIMPMYLNLFVHKPSLSLSGTMIALVLGLSTLHQILLRKYPVLRLILIGYSFLILGLLCMVVTLTTKSLFFLVLTTVFIGLGNGPSFAGSLAYLNQASSDESRAKMTSSFFVITYLGISLPILSLGYLGEWIGLVHAILLFVYVMIGLIIISLLCWIVRGRQE